MAIIINSINDGYFELNNLKYIKQFIPLKQGVNHLAISSSQNSSLQILSSTHFSEFLIDGKKYNSLKECINDLLPIIYSKNDSRLNDLINRIEALEAQVFPKNED